jgi:hypothetical protein
MESHFECEGIEYSYRDELMRILKYARNAKYEEFPLWSIVGHMTGHGSGVSSALCKSLGFDPWAIPAQAEVLRKRGE